MTKDLELTKIHVILLSFVWLEIIPVPSIAQQDANQSCHRSLAPSASFSKAQSVCTLGSPLAVLLVPSVRWARVHYACHDSPAFPVLEGTLTISLYSVQARLARPLRPTPPRSGARQVPADHAVA